MAVLDVQRDVLDRSRTVPVLVDFWAEWCGPCRTLGPVLERIAAQAAGRFELVQVDTDASPEIAARYGIRSIPTMLAFKGGKMVDRQVGLLPMNPLKQWLERHAD